MNYFLIDVKDGRVLINGCLMAPIDLDGFKRNAKASLIRFEDVSRNSDWPTYGANVKILDQVFWVNFSFCKDKLNSVWLSWDGGIVSKKGYEATEKELISDKKTLSRFMGKVFEKGPEIREYNHDAFLFEWGYVSISASLQTMAVSVGISWTTDKIPAPEGGLKNQEQHVS